MVQTSDPTTSAADLDALIRDRVDAMVAARVDELFAVKEAERAAKPKKIAIIATKGTLDWAYPPLILATTAKTLGWDAGIFFTFYGLAILKKDRKLEVGTTGNPAMPMPIPMPQLLTALPGMTPMASWMMKRQFKDHGVASIDELLDLADRDGREDAALRDDDGRVRLLGGRVHRRDRAGLRRDELPRLGGRRRRHAGLLGRRAG